MLTVNHGHVLLLLNHVVIVVKLCCVEGLWEIDVHLISTLVNKKINKKKLFLRLLMEHVSKIVFRFISKPGTIHTPFFLNVTFC